MFIDYTDSLNYRRLKENRISDSSKIASLFSRTACHSAEFRVIGISNLGHGIDEAISYNTIPEEVTEFTMPDDVFEFFNEIQPVIKRNTKQVSSRLDKTKIFEPLCMKIQQLNEAPQGRKIMLLYSDMLENSDALQMYRGGSLDNVDSILKSMEATCRCTLPSSMKDIEIYVVNHRDVNSDTLIRNAYSFWGKIFSDRNTKQFQMGSSPEFNK
jgi:hypothetical protein